MKKIITCILFLFAVPTLVQGQAAILALIFGDKVASEKFNLSMEIGGNFNHYSNLDNYDRTKLGINFGIAGNVKVSERFYISPAIFFLGNRKMKFENLSLNTASSSLNSNFQNVPTDLNLNYLDIPIMFSYMNKKGNFKYSIGPQFSFLQSANMVYFGEEGEFTENFKSNMNSQDFGFITDIAYILKDFKPNKEIHIHLRYYYGWNDAFSDAFNANRNRSSYLSVLLSFPFIKSK